MTTRTFRIPNIPASPPGQTHNLRVRARNVAGDGEASPAVDFRSVAPVRVRQIRHNADWFDVSDYAIANLISQFLARTTHTESSVISEAANIVALRAQIASDIATAIRALTTRVENNEMGISSAAAELTALDARIQGQHLGPETNEFTGDDRMAAEDARNAYATANPSWLADYDADDDLHIRLKWGTLRVYQNREGGAWVDSSEVEPTAGAVTALNALARMNAEGLTAQAAQLTQLVADLGAKASAAALTALTTRVTANEGSITSQATSITALQADVMGRATVTALTELTAMVTSNTDGLARWLVKLQVGDLVGGIGLYNDGTDVRLTILADKFAILPTGATDTTNRRIPFAVTDGKVWLDSAVIREGTITNAMIGNAVITGAKIVTGTITFANIARGKIWDIVENRSIVSDNFVAGTAGFRFINNGTAQLPAAAILGQLTAAQIGANAITGAKIMAGAITSTKLVDGSITSGKIAAEAVTAAKILDGTILGTKIKDGEITTTKLAANSVTAAKIEAGAVTAGKLSVGERFTVDSNDNLILKIGSQFSVDVNGNLIANNIDANIITAGTLNVDRINAGSIVTGKLAANAVSQVYFERGTVTTPTTQTTIDSVSVIGQTGFDALAIARFSVVWGASASDGDVCIVQLTRAGTVLDTANITHPESYAVLMDRRSNTASATYAMTAQGLANVQGVSGRMAVTILKR